MKRILLVIPNLDFGGAQTSFARLTQLLQNECDLLLVVFNKDNIAPLDLRAELVDLQVDAGQSILMKVVNFIKRVKRLRKIKKKFRPDTSISFLEGADYVNILSSVGEQILFYIHGSKLHDRNITGWLGWIRKKILVPYFYSKADSILVVNEQLQKELSLHFRLSKSSFHWLPNFYDFTEMNELAQESIPVHLSNLFATTPTISISGRIAPEKGIDRFVKILPKLLESIPEIKVLIIGDGLEKRSVQKACDEMSIRYQDVDDQSQRYDATILFLGYKKNPYCYVGRSTLLALPSLNEGMPNTIVEAMGLGVPVVAADCPYGPRQLLSRDSEPTKLWPEFAEFGILVPVLNGDTESEQAWVAAITKLMQSETLRKNYSEKGKAQSLAFSKEANLMAWKKLLRLYNDSAKSTIPSPFDLKL